MVRRKESAEMINIAEHIPALRSFLENDPRVLAAYLYGSYGTEYQTPLSDVDLAVLLKRDVALPLQEELLLASELAGIAQEDDLNLLILNKAPITIQFRVISTGRPIFVRDKIAVADFVEWVLKIYGDYSIDLREFARDQEAYLK